MFVPIVRRNVLLPAMFEPVTSRNVPGGPSATSLSTRVSGASRGDLPAEPPSWHAVSSISGMAQSGCACASPANAASASISPSVSSQARARGPILACQPSRAASTCTSHSRMAWTTQYTWALRGRTKPRDALQASHLRIRRAAVRGERAQQPFEQRRLERSGREQVETGGVLAEGAFQGADARQGGVRLVAEAVARGTG